MVKYLINSFALNPLKNGKIYVIILTSRKRNVTILLQKYEVCVTNIDRIRQII